MNRPETDAEKVAAATRLELIRRDIEARAVARRKRIATAAPSTHIGAVRR